MTSTNGASSSSLTAWRNGCRNSSPPSVGDSTLLWRLTLGRPGIAPSSTSSMPGWPAAVIDTESPSQLMPSEIQRMWTSSTPGGVFGSVAMACPSNRRQRIFLELERRPPAAPRRAAARGRVRRSCAHVQREVRQLALRPAVAAAPAAGTSSMHQLGALDRRALGHAARTRTSSAEGTTWRRWPTVTSTCRHPPAAARGAPRSCTIDSAIESSCISRSSAAGRRRAGPSRAGRRTRSRPAPCRAARS